MLTYIEKAYEYAVWFVENKATVRQTAKHFGVSKSTAFKYLKEIAKRDPEVRALLDKNKDECTMRGGLATASKWQRKEGVGS